MVAEIMSNNEGRLTHVATRRWNSLPASGKTSRAFPPARHTRPTTAPSAKISLL